MPSGLKARPASPPKVPLVSGINPVALPRERNRSRVQMYSFGLKSVGMQDENRSDNPTAFAQRLRTRLYAWSSDLPKIDYVFNCRSLYDDGWSSCTGKALSRLDAIYWHPKLDKVFKPIKAQLLPAIIEKKSFAVLFFCRAGCQRSVSVALVLKFILKRLGASVVGPEHLSNAEWDANICRGACDDCLNSNPARRVLMDKFFEHWEQHI